MNLTSGRRSRERILLYGTQGVGKSNAVLTIAKRCDKAKFHIIDNEHSYYTLIEEFAEPAFDFTCLDTDERTEIHTVDRMDWPAHIDKIIDICKRMGRDDWLVIDKTSTMWTAVQHWFTEQVFGKDMEEYLVELRQQLKAGSKNMKVFEGFTDWAVVNPEFARFYTAVLNCPGHVIATADATPLGENESKANTDTFKAIGLKPKGQKEIAQMFSTVILMTKSRGGEFEMTSLKQRGRADFENVPFTDFAKEYLMGVAGWKIEVPRKKVAP